MQYVCEDADSKWVYSPEEEKYYRLYDNGNYTYIFGKYIPDPDFIFEQRSKMKSRGQTVDRLEATPATKAIFNHWINSSLKS